MKEKLIKEIREANVERAAESDLPEILSLQKLSYVSEAEIYDDFGIPPLAETLSEIVDEFSRKVFLKIVLHGKIIATIRGYAENSTCFLETLMVHPDFQGHDQGTKLINELESLFSGCSRFELFTGHKSLKNIHIYTKLGYKVFKAIQVTPEMDFIFMVKEIKRDDL
jgi:GNAT superfamily N-acetyltransferase